jgi:hypothetical protein
VVWDKEGIMYFCVYLGALHSYTSFAGEGAVKGGIGKGSHIRRGPHNNQR